MTNWLGPFGPFRGMLPAEMRVLRGVLGLLGGVLVLFGLFVILIGGNWQLGYGDDRFLAGILFVIVPGVLGLASPLWYWVGRPLWFRLDNVTDSAPRAVEEIQFLPGLAGTGAGIALFFPVEATSGMWVQSLAPLGVFVAVGSPLWFWLLRPLSGRRITALPDDEGGGRSLVAIGERILPVVVALLLSSAGITAVIALPIATIGESVPQDDVAITVTNVRTVMSVDTNDRGTIRGEDDRGFRVVRLAVENRGDAHQQLPVTTVSDVALIAPTCHVQNFGEPHNNCNLVYLDGNFSVGGETFSTYETRQTAAGGTIAPGERIAGWFVFRIETASGGEPEFDAMVIVDDVGRWHLSK